jgi:hypothetical protein
MGVLARRGVAPLAQLGAHDVHAIGRLDSETYATPADFQNLDRDILANVQPFTLLSAKNEHHNSSLNW